MKKFNQTALYNFLIKFLAIINTYYCIKPHFTGEIMNINHIFIGISVFIFFILIKVWKRTISKSYLFVLLIPLLAWIFVFVKAPYSNIAYYIKWMELTISILLYLTILGDTYQINKSTYNFVYLSSIMIVIIYGIEALNMDFYTYTNSGTKLILTTGNQNSAAMQLLLISGVLFILLKKFISEKRVFLSFTCFIALISSAYMIYLTGSRSTLIGIILILIFAVFPKLKVLINSKTIPLLAYFPLIFAIVFVLFYINGYNELIILGRNIFNGREEMWHKVFSQPINNWLFGSYHIFTVIGQPPFQLHNGIVDMIASYGIIVTIMFLTMIINWMKKTLLSETKYSYVIVICVLALILESSGEAAIFIGGRCTFLATLLFFSSAE